MIDVLAIGPHPDDIELGAGGTVARLTSSGLTVGLIDLTRGERATRGTPETREGEAAVAAKILGAQWRRCLGLPDAGIAAGDTTQLEAVVAVLREHGPSVVITMDGNDDHPDHMEGASLVERACYLSGLRNYGGNDGEPVRPRGLWFAMGRRPFSPSFVVDVTAAYERKREAVAAYASQFSRKPGDPAVTPISDPGFLPALEARDRYHGSLIGVELGEAFRMTGPVPVRSFETWFGGSSS